MTVFGKIFADIHSWDWYQLKPDGAHPASEQRAALPLVLGVRASGGLC